MPPNVGALYCKVVYLQIGYRERTKKIELFLFLLFVL